MDAVLKKVRESTRRGYNSVSVEIEIVFGNPSDDELIAFADYRGAMFGGRVEYRKEIDGKKYARAMAYTD